MYKTDERDRNYWNEVFIDRWALLLWKHGLINKDEDTEIIDGSSVLSNRIKTDVSRCRSDR